MSRYGHFCIDNLPFPHKTTTNRGRFLITCRECAPFGAALARRKSGLAHRPLTLGSGLVPLEVSVPRQFLAFHCPRGTGVCELPCCTPLVGHLSGS